MTPANTATSLALLLAGMGVPIMAALNAGLGAKLGSPLAAVFVLSTVAAIFSLVVVTVIGHPDWTQLTVAPRVQLLAGLLFVFYLGTITFGAPRIGLGNAVLLVLFGQIVCATVIDHFALLGSIWHALTPRRILGLLLMGAGVILARG
ncbi:MAG: DMT family transporter [Erythrobacter sp.]